MLGDDITTDHISPAGQIRAASEAGRFLVAAGEPADDLNVYASRRGNWRVMLRGLSDNRTVRNLLADCPPGSTLLVPSDEIVPLPEAAPRYAEDGAATVIVAGERFGMGSSRDWAAKGQALLGVRAVLASGFERIHPSNLIGMGILPLRLTPGVGPVSLALRPGDTIDLAAEAIVSRGEVTATIVRADGRREAIACTAAVETRLEVAQLEAGGIIPIILRTAAEKTTKEGSSGSVA